MKPVMTDSNLFQEVQEDLERQRLEALWKRYGQWIIAGAVVILLTATGYNLWTSSKQEKNEALTAALIQAQGTDTSANAEAVKSLTALAQEHPGHAQAAIAGLHAAAALAHQGDVAGAVKIYDMVASDTKVDVAFRQFADLMAVAVQMDAGQPALLLKRLQPLEAENAPWRFTAMEYAGHLAFKSGDKEKARQIFTELSQEATLPSSMTARANDMLRLLAE